MSKRSYRQNCALALASDIIGERWSVLLIRDLLIGPRRYSELARSMQGMGTNLLASRLKQLEAAGLILRETLEGAGRQYSLTSRGRALEPAIVALIRWGMVHGPGNEAGYHHQHDWDLLALKALFRPDLAGGLAVLVQFDAEDLVGWMEIRDGHVRLGRGLRAKADIRLRGTVKDLFLGEMPPEDLVEAGDPMQLRRFMTAFAIPAA
jgi:DNA-binding HxlR family transcriptional regulator